MIRIRFNEKDKKTLLISDAGVHEYPIGKLLIDFIELDWGSVERGTKKLLRTSYPKSRKQLITYTTDIQQFFTKLVIIHPYFGALKDELSKEILNFIDCFDDPNIVDIPNEISDYFSGFEKNLKLYRFASIDFLKTLENVLDEDCIEYANGTPAAELLREYINGAIPSDVDKFSFFSSEVCYSFEHNKDSKTELCEDFIVDSKIEKMCYLELIKMVKNNITIKRCENCEKYFLPASKNSRYCDRISEGETLSCTLIGPRKKYLKSISGTVMEEYRKVYKTCNARVRNGKWKQEENEVWASTAKEKLNEVLNGELSEDEFRGWLNQIYVKKQNPKKGE